VNHWPAYFQAESLSLGLKPEYCSSSPWIRGDCKYESENRGGRGKSLVQVLIAMKQTLPRHVRARGWNPFDDHMRKGPKYRVSYEEREFEEREHVLKAKVRQPINGA
jgi:hypothetical protein